MRSRLLPALAIALLGVAAAQVTTFGNDHAYKVTAIENGSVRAPSSALSAVPCVDGKADVFSCDGLDLLGFVPDDEMVTVRDPLTGCALEVPVEDPTCLAEHTGISDIWGWVSDTGREYVIFGKTNGTAFYDVTDPTAPAYLGEIPTIAGELLWHDVKVLGDYAYIGSESVGYGVVIFDLTQLDDLGPAPAPYFPLAATARWEPDAVPLADSSNHNVVVNEDNGQLYLVGGNAALVVGGWCSGGLYAVDLSDPVAPEHVGCFEAEGNPYIHDAQCAAYVGPDPDHRGAQICVTSNEDFVAWVDVTDPANMTEIARVEYDLFAYAHQGWMSEDQTLYFHGDELDELDQAAVTNTRTIVVDMTDLDAPAVAFINEAGTVAIDHNMYTHEGLLYQSNYTAGLRVFDVSDTAQVLEDGVLTEVAFFDTFPDDDDAPVTQFNGTWSNYPYLPSGTIAVSGIGEGLFLLGDLDALAVPAAAGGGDDGIREEPGGAAPDAADDAGDPLAATGGGAAALAVLALAGAALLWRRRREDR